MNPIQPSSSPWANIVNNEANEAQAQPLPIAENPGNLALSVSPKSQPRAVQLGVENEGKALKSASNFLKELMSLPKELQVAILNHVNTLEDCEKVFQGLKEGVETIEASKLDPGSKEAEIKKLKDLFFTLLKACTIKKLDFSSSPESFKRLTAMAIFLGWPIRFKNVSEFVVSGSLLSLISTVLEFSNKKVTIHIDSNSTELPNMSPLADCKAIHIGPRNQSEWLQLRSLNGLEKCSNLTILELDVCHVLTGISPLTDLKQLTYLGLDNCPTLIDISPLTDLTQLTSLNLSNCPVLTDISPLAGLTQLTVLNLSNCHELIDISPLVGLTQLTSLGLSNCPVLTDIRPLAGLIQLTVLGLSNCHALTDISPLAGLTQLTVLNLNNCHALTDIRPLAGLTQLTNLYLAGSTNIQNLEVLQKSLPNLSVKL